MKSTLTTPAPTPTTHDATDMPSHPCALSEPQSSTCLHIDASWQQASPVWQTWFANGCMEQQCNLAALPLPCADAVRYVQKNKATWCGQQPLSHPLPLPLAGTLLNFAEQYMVPTLQQVSCQRLIEGIHQGEITLYQAFKQSAHQEVQSLILEQALLYTLQPLLCHGPDLLQTLQAKQSVIQSSLYPLLVKHLTQDNGADWLTSCSHLLAAFVYQSHHSPQLHADANEQQDNLSWALACLLRSQPPQPTTPPPRRPKLQQEVQQHIIHHHLVQASEYLGPLAMQIFFQWLEEHGDLSSQPWIISTKLAPLFMQSFLRLDETAQQRYCEKIDKQHIHIEQDLLSPTDASTSQPIPHWAALLGQQPQALQTKLWDGTMAWALQASAPPPSTQQPGLPACLWLAYGLVISAPSKSPLNIACKPMLKALLPLLKHHAHHPPIIQAILRVLCHMAYRFDRDDILQVQQRSEHIQQDGHPIIEQWVCRLQGALAARQHMLEPSGAVDFPKFNPRQISSTFMSTLYQWGYLAHWHPLGPPYSNHLPRQFLYLLNILRQTTEDDWVQLPILFALSHMLPWLTQQQHLQLQNCCIDWLKENPEPILLSFNPAGQWDDFLHDAADWLAYEGDEALRDDEAQRERAIQALIWREMQQIKDGLHMLQPTPHPSLPLYRIEPLLQLAQSHWDPYLQYRFQRLAQQAFADEQADNIFDTQTSMLTENEQQRVLLVLRYRLQALGSSMKTPSFLSHKDLVLLLQEDRGWHLLAKSLHEPPTPALDTSYILPHLCHLLKGMDLYDPPTLISFHMVYQLLQLFVAEKFQDDHLPDYLTILHTLQSIRDTSAWNWSFPFACQLLASSPAQSPFRLQVQWQVSGLFAQSRPKAILIKASCAIRDNQMQDYTACLQALCQHPFSSTTDQQFALFTLSTLIIKANLRHPSQEQWFDLLKNQWHDLGSFSPTFQKTLEPLLCFLGTHLTAPQIWQLAQITYPKHGTNAEPFQQPSMPVEH